MHRAFLLIFLLLVLALITPLAGASWSDHFYYGTRDAFTDSNKWVWAAGGALTLIALKYDHDIYKDYAKKERDEFTDKVGDNMGTGIPGAAIALATMGVGWAAGRPHTFAAGQSHGEALVTTFMYTSFLKILIERDRPPAFSSKESAFNSSFPSGHTSTAFATAGNIMASAGPWVGVPVLALAGLTGYSRIQRRAHYTSDVLFGATLGYTMGAGFYKHHQYGEVSSAWNIYPYFNDRESFGVVAQYGF
jgi:membrane-associated phospholipid phosphatase